MAISLIGTAQSGIGSNGDDVTLTFDTAPQQYDVVLLFGCHGDASSVIDTPTGYTAIWTVNDSGVICGAFYKVMGASPDSDVTFSGSGELTDSTSACCFVLRGVDNTTPMDATRTVGTGTSAPPVTPAITTVTDNAWVFSVAYSDATDAAIVGPSGYSTPVGAGGADTNDASVWAAYLEIESAGAEDPGNYSFYGVTSRYYTLTVAVRPGDPPSEEQSSPIVGRSARVLLEDGGDVLLESGGAVLLEGVPTPAEKVGRGKRGRKYSVEVDDEIFLFDTIAEAQEFLLLTRETAEQAAQVELQRAEKTKTPVKVPRVRVKLITGKPSASKALAEAQADAERAIQDAYQKAAEARIQKLAQIAKDIPGKGIQTRADMSRKAKEKRQKQLDELEALIALLL